LPLPKKPQLSFARQPALTIRTSMIISPFSQPSRKEWSMNAPASSSSGTRDTPTRARLLANCANRWCPFRVVFRAYCGQDIEEPNDFEASSTLDELLRLLNSFLNKKAKAKEPVLADIAAKIVKKSQYISLALLLSSCC
jgi:hypothetical protein